MKCDKICWVKDSDGAVCPKKCLKEQDILHRRKWHPLKAVKGLFAKKKVKPVKVKELATQEKLCL